MVKCGPAGMPACNVGLVGLAFRVRDKVRVSVRDRVGVRVGDGVWVSTFYFLLHLTSSPQNYARIRAGPHFTHNPAAGGAGYPLGFATHLYFIFQMTITRQDGT